MGEEACFSESEKESVLRGTVSEIQSGSFIIAVSMLNFNGVNLNIFYRIPCER